MKCLWTAAAVLAVTALSSSTPARADEAVDRAAQLEQAGNAAQARAILLDAVQRTPDDTAALSAYAEFLDRYRDPEARTVYRNLLAKLTGNPQESLRIQRRLILLDLVEGDANASHTDLAAYAAAGGKDGQLGAAPVEARLSGANPGATSDGAYIDIPGPLRSFARMAAIAVDAAPEDILPAVSRNVIVNGYQASRNSETLEPTEYMKLLLRYISQARELEQLAGPTKIIKIDTCDSSQTADLLRIIGFRMRGGCGSEVVLETVNAARAFLTSDSGFPTAQLEQALRTNRPFVYDFHPSHVPVLFSPDYWVSAKEKGNGDYLDAFLGDPTICRFYLGMSKLNRTTADELHKNVPAARLHSYASVLDFFGSLFEIRDGKAVVPGGKRSAQAWSDLVGVSWEHGPQFFERLLAKDDGWMASLYDSLARIHGPVQEYLTDPVRMKRFYAAVRGDVTSPGPARPVFRANTDMVLLTTRLRIDANGYAHIPGGVAAWRDLFGPRSRVKYDAKLARTAAYWGTPDDVLEALFGMAHKAVGNEPLRIFMTLSDVDRFRAAPLASNTVEVLIRNWRQYGPQYSVFAEAPALSDATILAFIDTASALDRIRDPQIRADAAASMQATVGLWQIFCRHASIPASDADASLAKLLAEFAPIKTERDVFDADRKSVAVLLSATHTPPGADPQARILSLLAGSSDNGESEPRDQVVKDMQRVLDAQEAVSLTSLLAIASNVEQAAAGQKADMALVQKLAGKIAEIQLPQPPLSVAEKNVIGAGYWTDKHIATERKMNLRAMIDQARPEDKVREVEGALAPHMRDTLVALNYAHYAPPGAQILYTNPLFVRSHEFVDPQGTSNTWKETVLLGAGWPSNGGGRLTGSLANLPYALAEAEQNFMVPSQTQALIWGDLAPQMILSAKLPRWWNVTPVQMHWVNLNMRLGETLLAEAAIRPQVSAVVFDTLHVFVPPQRVEAIHRDLGSGNVHAAIETLTPAELFNFAGALRNSPELAPVLENDPASREMRSIAAQHAADVSDAAISSAFGTPKPTLANSYRPELLRLQTFPSLMGYSSRIMAESWESNTLYWAALADQKHLAPAELNVVIPEWTQKVIERIFASHLEDWPALLKSLRTVGDEVRAGTVPGQPAGA